MRPIHLSLRNFRSHDDTNIDFTGVHVASISGSNGAGKSSLLNAITWALYGAQALGLGKQSDSIIREGATEATVTLVFDVAGERHRIVRCRKASGKSTLELARIAAGIIDAPGEPTWTSMSRGTLSETQDAIVELFDQSRLFELVERSIERRGPETRLAVRQFLHCPRDAEAVQVGIRESEQDQVDAVLHALYQTV